MAHHEPLNCLFCGEIFQADARNAARQKYCSKPPCRRASQAASRRAWLEKPKNQDYFRGPENVVRVQLWRAAHPGYWRRSRRESEGERRKRCLRYKMSAQPKWLKSLAIQQRCRKMRYKMSGVINRLF